MPQGNRLSYNSSLLDKNNKDDVSSFESKEDISISEVTDMYVASNSSPQLNEDDDASMIESKVKLCVSIWPQINRMKEKLEHVSQKTWRALNHCCYWA